MTARAAALLRVLARLADGDRTTTIRRERSRRRAARTAVWSGVAAFVLATVGLVAALETQTELRDPEYGHRLNQLRELRAASPDRPLVLLVGSSRTQMGVSPAEMGFPDEPGSPLVYNLGLVGAPPPGIRFQLFRTLAAGVRPDFVLVELFVANFAYNIPLESQKWARPERFSAADLRYVAGAAQCPHAVSRRWAAARANPWVSHRLSLAAAWLPDALPPDRVDLVNWREMDARGHVECPLGVAPPEVAAARREKVRQEHQLAFGNFRAWPWPDQAAREIVGRCRAEGIPVAFFRPPVSPAFQGWFTPKARAGADGYAEVLSRELGVPVFPAPDLPEDAFLDGHHLVPPAVPPYSRWLADTHLKPWLAARK